MLSTKDPCVISSHKKLQKPFHISRSLHPPPKRALFTHTNSSTCTVCVCPWRGSLAVMLMLLVVSMSTTEPITNNSHSVLISVHKDKTLTGDNEAHTYSLTPNLWNWGVAILYIGNKQTEYHTSVQTQRKHRESLRRFSTKASVSFTVGKAQHWLDTGLSHDGILCWTATQC